MHGGDVDHTPPPLLVHAGQRRTHDPEGRLEHNPQYHGETLGREVLNGGDVLQTRIVDDDVRLYFQAIEHPVVREVRLHRLAADLVRDLPGAVTVQVEHGNRSTRPGQPLGAGPPDPTRRPSNQSATPGQ